MNSFTSNAKVIGLSGSNQEPPRRRLRKNANDFIPEKRGKRKDPTSIDNERQRGVSKANVSHDQLETRFETVSVSDTLQFTASKTTVNDSTLSAFSRRPSNRKRKWEAMTTSTPKDEVVATSNASQEPVRKRSRKNTNESCLRKSIRRMIDANCSKKEVHMPTSNATKSSANDTGASSVQKTIDSRVDSVSTSEITQLDAPTTKTNDRCDRQNIVQKRRRQKLFASNNQTSHTVQAPIKQHSLAKSIEDLG